jgi:trehalose 6-phosphate synthase
MSRLAQFILTLIVGLALLTWAASGIVQTTAKEWFERDVSTRAQLVLIGASQSLANAWFSESDDLPRQLLEIAGDERIMGVAACNADLTPRSVTPGFPIEFGCAAVGRRIRAADASEGYSGNLREWSTVTNLPTGRVHVSVMPILSDGTELGFAILVHDMSYIERREAQARTFLLLASGFLAIMAFGVPMFVAKWARYDWSREFRSLLRGHGKQRQEFKPILSDVR